MTVETAVAPAGPYARATKGSTGTGPSAVTSCPDTRPGVPALVANVVSRKPALARWSRIASSQGLSVTVSITRPSKHHPTFVYDQNGDPGRLRRHRQRAARAHRRPGRFYRRSRTPDRRAAVVQRDSQEGLAESHAWPSGCREARARARRPDQPETSDRLARRAITVATIDLVRDPRLKSDSRVTGSPVLTSATP